MQRQLNVKKVDTVVVITVKDAKKKGKVLASLPSKNRVVVEGGDILEKEEAGCRTGTTITVRNLFFNTPVRYKFLKKDYTESGYIEDAITRIALVNPNIAIKLINTGKTVIQTNGNGDMKSAIYSIYGKDIANGILDVEYTYDDIKINGVIGKPEIARSNRSNQLFFVNKRYIKDKILTAATEQGYKGLIPIGKFGFVVLNLTINPAKVDVNVHPAKLEVRFEEENKVFQAIYHAIKDTLLKNDLVAGPKETKKVENVNYVDRSAVSFEERLRKLKEAKKAESMQGGLFSFRKQNEKKIEEYNDEESKIKTNNIIEDIYNKKENNIVTNTLNVNNFDVDTNNVLSKLRQMKENIEKELLDKNITPTTLEGLADESASYKNDDGKVEEKVEESEVKDDITKEENGNDTPQDTHAIIETIENEEVKKEFDEVKEKLQDLSENPKVVSEDFNEMYTKLFGRAPIMEDSKETKKEDEIKEGKLEAIDIVKDNVSMFDEKEDNKKPTYKFIGIVFKTYIILEMNNEMYILDQHAAHERIMYEKVKKNYYSEATKDSQMLLLPDIITLTHKEMDIAKDNMQMFKKAGFTLEEFGENTIKLTGVPTVCIDLDTKELFLETLDEINTVARTAKQEKEEKFIATVACKAAVKANMALTAEEVDSLMQELLQLPNPFTCPHGRPTAIKMTKYDIERKFARK